MYDVLIKNGYAALNVDNWNRTVVCEEDVPNGAVFALSEYSTDADSKIVWKAGKPTAEAKNLWMASSPEVVETVLPDGTVLKGIDNNVRDFVNIKGHPIDAFKLMEDDVITIVPSETNATAMGTAKYLIPDAGKFALKVETTTAPTAGMYLKALGATTAHIGDGNLVKKAVTAYKFLVCVA